MHVVVVSLVVVIAAWAARRLVVVVLGRLSTDNIWIVISSVALVHPIIISIKISNLFFYLND